MYLFFLFCCAVILFLLTGLLGKVMYRYKETLFNYSTYHSYSEKDETLGGTFLLKTFFPSVYIVAVAWVLQMINAIALTQNIWIVVAIYWGIRLFWLLIIFNRASLTNYIYEFLSLAISIGFAILVYYVFIEYCINNGISVFLSRDELRSGIAFALFLYSVSIIWKIINTSELLSRRKIYNDHIVLGDLEKRTKRLYLRYGDFVKETFLKKLDEQLFFDNEYFLTILFFSIMIVEDRNRPFLIRKFENLIHRTIRKNRPMTVGIMQIKSKEVLSDKESIVEAVSFIVSIFQEYEDSQGKSYSNYDIECKIIDSYNSDSDYSSEIDFIQQVIGQWLDIVVG